MIPLIISIVCAAAIAVLFWYKRVYAVAALLFLLPTYVVRFSLWGIPTTMLEILMLTLFIVFVCRTVSLKTRSLQFRMLLYYKILFILIALLLIASVFGILTTPNIHAGLGMLKAYIIEPILFCIVFISCIQSKKDIQIILRALALSALVISLITIVQYFTGFGIPDTWHAWPGRRATAVYGFPNAVGLYLAPIIAAVIGTLTQWSTLQRYERVTGILTLVLGCAALLAAQVEGAIIAVLAAAGVIALGTKFRVHTVVVGIAGVIAAFSISQTRSLLLFQDTSGDVRLALWKGTLSLLTHQPLFGSGLGGFPATYDLYRLPSHTELLLYPHNIIFDFWTQLGLLGLMWILLVLAAMAFLLWKQRKAVLAPALIGAWVCIAVYGCVDVLYFKNDLSILFWTWICLVLLLPYSPKLTDKQYIASSKRYQ